jgi:predicted transcriptional regulator
MAKKTFKRIQRVGKLTDAEAERDRELRHKIEAEYPPVEATPSSAILSDPLKEAISRSGKSVTQLAKEAGVSQAILSQFLAGQRDLRLATAEKLAHVLKLKLVSH